MHFKSGQSTYMSVPIPAFVHHLQQLKGLYSGYFKLHYTKTYIQVWKWRPYVNDPMTSSQAQLSQINTLANPRCNLAALLAPFCLINHCSQQPVKSGALSLPTTLLHVWTSVYF